MSAIPAKPGNENPDHHIQISGVEFGYPSRKIFEGIDITIPRGKITTIMGPSGSGKTTLLKLFTGQLYPQSGNVMVEGLSVPRLSRGQLMKLRIRMGMMFQTSALFTSINVFDNVAYPIREHTRLSESLIRTVVLMKLQAVGLRGAIHLMPHELSGGMMRRVALARAIALDPMILFYDDPFSGQDPVTLGVLMRLIKKLNQALGITSILVSHDADEVKAISDYLYIIGDGKVKEQGTPQELGHSSNAWAEQLLNGMPNGPVSFHYPAESISKDLHLVD
jgi:phospholipid/cholesterol/gamma-HCH transport system ATP-binding protein